MISVSHIEVTHVLVSAIEVTHNLSESHIGNLCFK